MNPKEYAEYLLKAYGKHTATVLIDTLIDTKLKQKANDVDYYRQTKQELNNL